MIPQYNTLAEIQRNCLVVGTDNETILAAIQNCQLERLAHPTENFSIDSDGKYYLVNDAGQMKLYRVRNPINSPKTQLDETILPVSIKFDQSVKPTRRVRANTGIYKAGL